MNSLSMLYAEDDIDVLQDTLFLLGPYFTTAYSAQDGEKALEVYHKNKPDIILLDINLPLLNGLDVAAKIRETDDTTPIVMISAYSDKDKLLSAINIGVSSYIIKPFKIDEIKETIEKLIEKSLIKNDNIVETKFKWDFENKKLFYKEQEIKVTKNEILLIDILLKNKQSFFSAEELAINIFGDTKSSSDVNNATQLISRFKKKIISNLDIDDFFIENIYGVGYRIKTTMITIV